MPRRRPPADRFWEKVVKTDSCWLWTAAKNKRGYGRFKVAGDLMVYAHRYSYELASGPIPDGMTVDHLCFQPSCVNPSHLEAVTQAENTRRYHRTYDHCPRGHAYTPDNLVSCYLPRRRCKACCSIRNSEYYARLREARLADAA